MDTASHNTDLKLFFALDIAEPIRQRLEDLSLRMQDWELPGRWTHLHDFHITLAYIGAVPQEELSYLLYNTEDIVSSQYRFSVQIAGCGAYAGKKWPRIVYAAVDDEHKILSDLHQSLSEACTLPDQGDYNPHITLCRPSGRGKKRQWPELLEAYALSSFTDYQAHSITLYNSPAAGTGSGQRYQSIQSWKLL